MAPKTRSATKATAAATNQSNDDNTPSQPIIKESIDDHLPPLLLVFTVMVCSGFVAMYAFRDVFATGRVVGGVRDYNYLVRFAVVIVLKVEE